MWSRCLYDTATAPAAVLDAAQRTHPWIVSPSGGRRLSGRYQDLSQFRALEPAPDPLEQSTPLVVLAGSSAAGARHALTQLGRGWVTAAVLDDLLLGTSEAINNAWQHGRPPVTIRIWAGPDRIVVCVHDTGPGPGDALAGLPPLPTVPQARNLGSGSPTSSTSTSHSSTVTTDSPSGCEAARPQADR